MQNRDLGLKVARLDAAAGRPLTPRMAAKENGGDLATIDVAKDQRKAVLPPPMRRDNGRAPGPERIAAVEADLCKVTPCTTSPETASLLLTLESSRTNVPV